MKDSIAPLNGFRIKRKLIPERIFVFSLFFPEEELKSRFSIIKKKFRGVYLTTIENPNVKVASWRKPDNRNSENLKLESTITFQELPTDKQEKLLLSYLKWETKIESKLGKAVPLSPKEYEKNFIAIPDVKKLAVKKINGNFYLFFDIGYHVRSRKSVYELVRENSITYQELEGKTLIYDPHGNKHGKRDLVKVAEIDFNPSRESLERVANYLFSKYGRREISLGVPILHVQYGRNETKYPTLPQYCFLDKKNFTRDLVLSNDKRKEILRKIACKVDFIEDDLLIVKTKEFSPPQYIVKSKEGNYRKIGKLRESINYPAFYIPDKLKKQKEIPIFVLADRKLPRREVDSFLAGQIKSRYLKLNKEGNPTRFKTLKNSSSELSFQVDFKEFEIPDKVKTALQEYSLGFAICISSKMLEDDYDKIKRLLFSNNVLSQFAIYEKWRKSPKYISQTLAFDIYSKLGIRLFTLDERLPYDFIIGVDVGNDMFNRRSKAGSVTVFLSDGTIKTMFPMFMDTGGERIDFLGSSLGILIEKLNVENKKLLILRDGNIHRKELESLASSYILKNKSVRVDIVNVKKRHAFRILSDFGPKAVTLGESTAVLLPHSIEGARSLLIDTAFSIENGKLQKLPITYPLLSILYKLTKVNLSTLFRENSMLRLPAPLHYADMFVKALGRNWKVSDELLKTGSLYFI